MLGVVVSEYVVGMEIVVAKERAKGPRRASRLPIAGKLQRPLLLQRAAFQTHARVRPRSGSSRLNVALIVSLPCFAMLPVGNPHRDPSLPPRLDSHIRLQ
jgi:hypothetical protein